MGLRSKFSAYIETQFGFFKAYLKHKARPGEYEKARFSFWWCIVIALCRRQLVDTRDLKRLHWDLNTWKDEEVQQWKDSHLASCNSIAVAGAIFATLGLTALQIPDMDEAWWTARAFCVVSMVLGVLSVITATRQHLDVVMLKSPLSVRLWLSRGQPRSQDGLPLWHESQPTSRYEGITGFEHLPLESSVMSLKAVNMPRHLLDLSVFAFMIGFGLYELSGWVSPAIHPAASNSTNYPDASNSTSCPDASSNEEANDKDLDVAGAFGPDLAYRNVFIVLFVTLSLCLIYWAKILDDVNYESMVKNEEFGTSSYGKGENIRLTELRKQLRKVQHDFKLVPPDLPESGERDVVSVIQELSRDLKDRDDQWRQIFVHALRQPPNQLRRTMSI